MPPKKLKEKSLGKMVKNSKIFAEETWWEEEASMQGEIQWLRI